MKKKDLQEADKLTGYAMNKLRNELTQKAIAKKCAEWIEGKYL